MSDNTATSDASAELITIQDNATVSTYGDVSSKFLQGIVLFLAGTFGADVDATNSYKDYMPLYLGIGNYTGSNTSEEEVTQLYAGNMSSEFNVGNRFTVFVESYEADSNSDYAYIKLFSYVPYSALPSNNKSINRVGIFSGSKCGSTLNDLLVYFKLEENLTFGPQDVVQFQIELRFQNTEEEEIVTPTIGDDGKLYIGVIDTGINTDIKIKLGDDGYWYVQTEDSGKFINTYITKVGKDERVDKKESTQTEDTQELP
jgi:hypothetical protein